MVQGDPTPLHARREKRRDPVEPDYVITQILVESDPFYRWYIVAVPVRNKDTNLVYGPYQYRDDAEKVGKRARHVLDSE